MLDLHFDLQNFSLSSAKFKSRGCNHDLHLFPLPYQSLNINNSKNMQHRQGVFLYFSIFTSTRRAPQSQYVGKYSLLRSRCVLSESIVNLFEFQMRFKDFMRVSPWQTIVYKEYYALTRRFSRLSIGEFDFIETLYAAKRVLYGIIRLGQMCVAMKATLPIPHCASIFNFLTFHEGGIELLIKIM